MTSGLDLIANNWKQAECAFYSTGTAVAVEVAAASVLTQQYWALAGSAAVGFAFDYAAKLAGCDHDPGDPDPGGSPTDGVDGCGESATPAQLEYYRNGEWRTDFGTLSAAWGRQITKIVQVEKGTGGGPSYSKCYVYVAGGTTAYFANADHGTTDPAGMKWRLTGGDCLDPDPLPPDFIGTPTTITDGECNWTFAPKDSFIDDQGLVNTYWVIEADNDACGGPFAYWSTANGPTPVAPVRPDGEPDPIPPKSKPCSDCPDPLELAQATYQMQGVCEDVGQGQAQPVAQWPIPSARYEQALAARIDALASMLQQHLEWRTPTCNARPTQEGEFRTISFVSDETSPNGRNRLRKRFRYRSVSGIGLAGVVDHWRAFTWQAGPVCVAHKGAYWGTPQVWAATAEEGKRVIRHAALEAGLDPDQTGGWVISGSDNPRFGMPGTMRVNTSGGYYWITERLGSDGRPQVEQT